MPSKVTVTVEVPKKRTRRTAPTPSTAPATHGRCVLVVDQSGSMLSIQRQTIDGLNAFMTEQRAVREVSLKATVHLFSTAGTTTPVRGVPVAEVPAFTTLNYRPEGGTPLYDAIGDAISEAAREAPMERCLFVIMTDGMENASNRYTRAKVFDLVNKMRVECGWDFVFLGANQDAYATGSSLGTGVTNTVNFAASPAAAAAVFDSVARSAKEYWSASANVSADTSLEGAGFAFFNESVRRAHDHAAGRTTPTVTPTPPAQPTPNLGQKRTMPARKGPKADPDWLAKTP